jgi:hypothetical protein
MLRKGWLLSNVSSDIALAPLQIKASHGDELYAPTGPCARRLNSDRHMVSRVAIIKLASQK